MSITAGKVAKLTVAASSMAVIFTIIILTVRGCGPDCELGDQDAIWGPWTRALDGSHACAASTEPAGCAINDTGCTAVLTAQFGADIPIEAVRTRLDVYFKGKGYVLDTANSRVGAAGDTQTRWVNDKDNAAFSIQVELVDETVRATLRHTPSAVNEP
ncbi:MAG: hypothetical protein ACI9MR_002492 [Myxococcota bacterium]